MRKQHEIDSDQMWSEETYSFSVKFSFFSFLSSSYIKFTPTTSWRRVKKDCAGVGWNRDMSFLKFSELSHAERNLLIDSILVSKKSKAFLVLISLKSYQTSFRIV